MAEFETAIFRVYERCIENLRDEEDGTLNSRTCKLMETISLSGGILFLVILLILHCSYVNQPGCLPGLLRAEMARGNYSDLLPFDAILQINVDKYFVGDAPSHAARLAAIDDAVSDEDGSRRSVMATRSATTTTTTDGKRRRRSLRAGPAQLVTSSIAKKSISSYNSYNSSSSNNNSSANATLPASAFNPLYFRVHDFEFAYDVGILELSGYLRQVHSFQLVNVTMEGPACLGNRFVQGLIPLGGIETVVMNSIFATVQHSGMMIDSHGDYNMWRERDLRPYSNPAQWLVFKVDMLCKSLFLFFLLTTVTALLVRMLISSGVVLLFPIFWLVQYLGYNVINMRLISLSYPWIGVPLEMLRGANQSSVPFLIGHMTRVVAYYTFYEATQFACSLWFYDQAQPGQRELWLFAIMMLWEYYSMIYVRAAGSIILFPRASLALFLIYHFYLFSFPTGFHLLALLVMLLLLLYLMMYCVRKYEIEAFHRGLVSSDQPRQFYNSIPWPIWSNALAPEYTVFMPAARRSTGLYNVNVPPMPGAGGGGAGAGAGAGVGGVGGAGVGVAADWGAGGGGGGGAGAGVASSTSGAGAGAAVAGAGAEAGDIELSGVSIHGGGPTETQGSYQRLPDTSSH